MKHRSNKKGLTMVTLVLAVTTSLILLPLVTSNRPPQFVLTPGQSEIVLRLKEGRETPVGTLITRLKGHDYEEDPLQFGIMGQTGNDLLRIETVGTNEANVYLKKELDRETQDSYTLILTLTDGHLSGGSFVTQSLLILVEDVNDNAPICRSDNSTVKVEENGDVPLILSTIECTDLDEGPYGQVIYKLETEPGDEDMFSLQQTKEGRGILKLLKPLDYDRKPLYQLRVIAMDRANTGQVNTATNPILLEVIDREDRPPEWLMVPSVTRISEDVSKGSIVLQVRAVDGDRGVNNPIVYSLLNENDLFGIDRDSGIVFTKGPLDRENDRNGGSYILQLLATEKTKGTAKTLYVSTEVTILLLDVNDETPTFSSKSYVAEIVENQPVDVPVTFLGNSVPECYDHDLGVNGTFRLYTEGDGGIFEITPSQGINQVSFLVRVKNPARLDYEKIKVINFTMVAEEIGEARKKSKVGITVFLRDANDNSPKFERDIYKVSVNENSPAGTAIVQIKAIDEDSGQMGTEGIRYTSLTGSIADELVLNPITGLITVGTTTGRSLDRELSSSYFLTVEARDSGGRGNRNTVQVQLVVNDVNDERPTFLLSKYEARIFENELAFIAPLILEAKDKDLPNTKNSDVRYVIVGGNHDDHFILNDTTGEIGLRKPLDFEALPIIPGHEESNVKKINLTVRANDLGSPPLSSQTSVTIWVLDKNDFTPEFSLKSIFKTVPEDTLGGSEILAVEAVDGDASHPFNRIFYRMENGAGDKFSIDADTGVVSLTAGSTLDFNLRSVYNLHIHAIDGGGLRSPTPVLVNISIEDVNNKPPKFLVNTPDGVYHAKVKENSLKGTFVIQVQARDPDLGSVLRYRLDFNKSEGRNEDGRVVKGLPLHVLFSMDPIEGILRVGGGTLDRETVEGIRLTVQVDDTASETGRQVDLAQILIQVQDEPDNEPVFRQTSYSTTLMENSKAGTLVLAVGADDADLDTELRYTLLPPPGDPDRAEFPVRIDPESGAVTVSLPKKIDRETRTWLNFTVLADDAGRPSRFGKGKGVGRASVFVRILDQNDNSPVFQPAEDEISVREDVKVGSIIGTVQAKDSDEGPNGRVSYVLDRTSSLGKFSIDPETGTIRIASGVDREETASYSLVVQAYDNWYGYPSPDSHTTVKNLHVTILDVNDCPPVFTGSEDTFEVTEFNEGFIGTVMATDDDLAGTPNSVVTFKIRYGNDLGLFKLDGSRNNQAKIVAARSLKGFYGNYTLGVIAEDGGTPGNTAEKEYHIQITDFNDNPPRFITAQNLTVTLAENATIGTTVTQIRALDSDTGFNGVVRYRFKPSALSQTDHFHIDATTGLITLIKPLDRKKVKLYHLRVEAYDLGQIPLTSELDVKVRIEKMTAFQPRFEVPNLTISFDENDEREGVNALLPETVGSEDEDEDVPVICYFILPNSKGLLNLFFLEPYEHRIAPKVLLDREEQASYSLHIGATTDCQGNNLPAIDSPATLHLTIDVGDLNDNSPKFERRVFSGGVSTNSPFGSVILDLSATDRDGPGTLNSELTFYIVPPIRMSLTEGLNHLLTNQSAQLFVMEGTSLLLNFDPQPEMKGYFSMEVGVRDGEGLNDRAVALVYLLREDQKVKVVVRRNPVEVRQNLDKFLHSLGNVTGARVSADMSSFKFHENSDGTVDRTKTDFYIHFVHPEKNAVLEVAEVLKLIDLKIEELDDLFKEFHVIDTQGSTLAPRMSKGLSREGRSLFLVYASGTAGFLLLLLIVVVSLACAQRSKYQRRLKAATANAYGSAMLPRTGNVPNTNVHSSEGSNPIWMQAYHNNWYKGDTHSISENSDCRGDSLEDNDMGSSPPSSHMRSFLGGSDEDSHGGNGKTGHRVTKGHRNHKAYHKNILYGHPIDKNSTCLILKKHLETTEL